MKNAYLSFLSRVGLPGEDRPVEYRPDGWMLHDTHGFRFAACADEANGMLLAALRDDASFANLDAYIDGSVIPGATALREEDPCKPDKVLPLFAAEGDNAVLSALITSGGITVRQTVFTFSGGIAVLGCDLDCGWDGSEPMPVFQTGVMRCFADPEKMKVHKNTTTHGGLIIRTLMDDIKPIRHIRPASPEGRETRSIFTMAIQTSPLMPCYAYEITTVGMGFGCQIMANSASCQAIMIEGGDILSFDPTSGILTRF